MNKLPAYALLVVLAAAAVTAKYTNTYANNFNRVGYGANAFSMPFMGGLGFGAGFGNIGGIGGLGAYGNNFMYGAGLGASPYMAYGLGINSYPMYSGLGNYGLSGIGSQYFG